MSLSKLQEMVMDKEAWWTGRPDVLQLMGAQRVGHDWATELNWTEGTYVKKIYHKLFMSLMDKIKNFLLKGNLSKWKLHHIHDG